jgi:hypothetical protein
MQYEEYRNISQGKLWVIIAVGMVLILAWGMAIHMMIPETPRHWNFNTYPESPSESKYSISQPRRNEPNVPIQLQRARKQGGTSK